MGNYLGNVQRVATTSIVESASGKTFRPIMSTGALNPATGSLAKNIPNVTRLVGVDYQMTTLVLTAGAGAYSTVVWPAVGFSGLMSAVQRYYSSGQNGAPPEPSVVANNNNPLIVGQSTQLLLICSVETAYSPAQLVTSMINLGTQATSIQGGRPLQGPWFPSGQTYTSFSCIPNGVILTPAAVSSIKITLGITAQLYSVFIQA